MIISQYAQYLLQVCNYRYDELLLLVTNSDCEAGRSVR